MKVMKGRFLVIVSFIFVAFFLFYFSQINGRVHCVKVIKGEIQDSVTGNVRVLAKETYQIKSRQSGIVSKVAKLPNEKSIILSKNDIIAQLDISDLNRSLNQAIVSKKYFIQKIDAGSPFKIELNIELDELNSLKKLAAEEKIPQSQLNRKQNLVDQLKTKIELEKISNEDNLHSLSTSIENLRAQIEKMTIRSPIDGELIFSNISPNELISTGQVVGTLVSKERLIEASLNEEDFHGLTVGLPAAVTLFSSEKKLIESKVSQLSNVVDSSTGRRLLYLKTNDSNHILPLGSTGRVSVIKRNKPNCLLIPKKALIGNSVFLVNNKQIEMRDIKAGIRTLQKVEVVEGLNVGDLVVSETPHIFNEGDLIEPIISSWIK